MKFFIPTFFTMIALLSSAFGSTPDSTPISRDLPLTSDETLSRVNRSPGILEAPSEHPTGDQAYLYYGLAKELPSETEASDSASD